MIDTYSFGEWMKQRRKNLRLTQREVAAAAFCSVAMIKKIEADERQPSIELAQALAAILEIPTNQHDVFIECARGKRPLDSLHSPPAHSGASSFRFPSLPTAHTPFLGRKAELTDISAKLRQPDCRLLTLLGPGGMGKTRLGIEAARLVKTEFADGVVYVPLAAVSDPAQIPQAIFQAMHLQLAGNDESLIQMQHFFRRRHLLLILDNFEQLTEGATLLSELLAVAPQLHLLVTSRERLNLVEEWLFSVPELDEAVALFIQTAVRVNPNFDIREEETTVSHICQLVGGHPLAIELAASWARFMSCADIAAQIQQDLDFLSHASRNTPERHHSLRALFDYSWQLLTPAEQNALAKLAVFRGGFALEQATAVTGATWPILLGLVDKSLVETQGNNRFGLHELTCQYAVTKLAETGQAEAAQQAHFSAYHALAGQLMNQAQGAQALISFRRSEQEFDNTRAALAWGLSKQQTEAVMEIIHHNYRFWLPGGHWREGEQWARTAVAQAGDRDSANLCLVLNHLAAFIALQGRFQDAFPYSHRAYGMAQRLEEPWPLALSLFSRGQASPDQATSLAAFDEAIAICRKHEGEQKFHTFLNSILRLRGDRLFAFGLVAEAKASFEESLARMRAIGEALEIAYPLGNLGRLALAAGDLMKARQFIEESVTVARESGNTVSIADWAFRLGQVYLYSGDWAAAETNLVETLRRYEEVNNHFGPPCVLTNLALVAVAQGDIETAVAHIDDSFHRYRQLNEAIFKIDPSADYFRFGDTFESLLHAGLVAHAQGDWQKALTFFVYFERNTHGYVALQPLQEKVTAAASDIQLNLAPAAYTTADAEAHSLTLDKLLDIWFA